MKIYKNIYLNLIKTLTFILILNIAFIQNVFAQKFVVTGHVYANINEFEHILEQSRKNNIETMFLLGDIKYEIMNKIDSYQQKHNIKIYTVPGNHEFPDDKYGKEYIKRFGNYRAIINGKELNILLNTMDNNSSKKKFNHAGYGIEGKQLEFLENTIKNLSNNITTINIFMHHSLFVYNLTRKEIQNIINDPFNKLNSVHVKNQRFLSNDLTKNNWYTKIHKILQKEANRGKNINVFSGDNSLSLHFKKDKVNYFLTGLRQYYKSPLHTKNLQSYILCEDTGKCDIKFFKNHSLLEKLDLLYHKEPSAIFKFSKSNRIKLTKKISSNYLFLERKKGSNCSFPSLLTLENDSYKEEFSGLKTSNDKMIIFTNNKPKKKYYDVIIRQNSENGISCEELTVKLFDNDDISKIHKYMKKFETYKVKLSSFEANKLYSKIPTIKERYNSKFRFQKAKGNIKFKENEYKIQIKPRGGTYFHWANKKKSYTVKSFKTSKPTKLFYIPEKRGMLGEHLVQKIAKFINLKALDSTFGYLEINKNNNGLYYIIDDFDKHFLLKNDLPESNIYHTDPYKTTSNYNVSEIKKNVFLGSIKGHSNKFDMNIDYFLTTINKDNVYLSANWKSHFDQENLVKMLALILFSGTTHYNLHNMYFYINPVNGKIYFFPWDFMNYSHGESINIKDSVKFRDSINFNPIFAKLLEINEIRYLRNKFIFEHADKIINFIEDFENVEVPQIFSAMILDQTIPLSTGEGNRKSFLDFMKISERIKDNIKYQHKKIKENITSLELETIIRDKSAELNFNLLSYAGIKIKCITMVFTDNSKSNCYEKNTKLFSNIEYHKSHRSNIKIKLTNNKINIPIPKDKTIQKIAVDYSNIINDTKNFNYIKKEVTSVLIRKRHEKIFSKVKENKELYPNILKQNSDQLFFRSNHVVLKKDLILPKDTTLNISPGTKITLDSGVSIISYGSIIAQGKKDKNITFSPLNKHKPWGTIAIVGQEYNTDSNNIFENCVFDGGSGANKRGAYFSGMLSAHYVNEINIKNCVFKNSRSENGGDDSINVKYGKAVIRDTSFVNNIGDAIDFDFVDDNSAIINSNFIDNKNDAIDISSSNIFIENCRINNSGDKGVSAGEKSKIELRNCEIYNSKFGIASKDSSLVKIRDSKILKNIIGIGLYNKKEYYQNPSIRVTNSKIEDNFINCAEETFNKFGHDNPLIIMDKKIKKTYEKYSYIINVNLKGMSKKDIIRAFYDNGNFDKYINYVTFKDCKLTK